MILDKKGPFPFTEAGVKGAYNLLESRRAKGKIVIEVLGLGYSGCRVQGAGFRVQGAGCRVQGSRLGGEG